MPTITLCGSDISWSRWGVPVLRPPTWALTWVSTLIGRAERLRFSLWQLQLQKISLDITWHTWKWWVDIHRILGLPLFLELWFNLLWICDFSSLLAPKLPPPQRRVQAAHHLSRRISCRINVWWCYQVVSTKHGWTNMRGFTYIWYRRSSVWVDWCT